MSFFSPQASGIIKVMPIFGTRPEAIKMAPVIRILAADARFRVVTVVTAQHREMLDQVLAIFDLTPAYDLDLMQPGQSLTAITCRVLAGLEEVIRAEQPDLVLVHGDTTTTFAAGLAAFYQRLPVGHVEAGLRTGDPYQPFPEEMNRRLAGALTALHFAPTLRAAANLRQEGVPEERIFITGNTVVDALLTCAASLAQRGIVAPRTVGIAGPYLLATIHRRENWGERLAGMWRALGRLLDEFTAYELVMPVHLNPLVQETVRRILGGRPRVHLLPPVDYEEMVLLMQGAHLILTDSGGIQEEAPALGKPVVVLRNTTERPEALAAGTVLLAGTKEEEIYAAGRRLLGDAELYNRMAKAVNPYGDGRAAVRIREAILYAFGFSPSRPAPFGLKGDEKASQATFPS
ncbi:MAG: UDP-N-acetylglucosamine 2-epimerase (non-hydrolyzing) [Firmicutes bacterium]|nr:UDP-N-acetylglucosamine 2-epimerase (non-hydrolyzing) [Bacillota bacterium]